MTRRCSLFVAALTAVALVTSAQPSAVAQVEFSTHVLVTLDDGTTPVTGLTAEDFELSIDGKSAPILRLDRDTTPLTMILAVDASRSMGEVDEVGGFTFQQSVAIGVLPGFTPGDRLGLSSIARTIRFSSGFGADPEVIGGWVRDVLAMPFTDHNGPSPIWDGVDDAVSKLESEPGRRVVVLITDGHATGNRHSLASVITHAQAADVIVSVIARGFDVAIPAGIAGSTAASNLALLPAGTGGTFLPERPLANLPLELARAVRQLHNLYTLVFAPPVTESADHVLQLRVKKVGAVAHVRRQYRTVGR